MAEEMQQACGGEEEHPLRAMVCVDRSKHAVRAFDYYVNHIHRADNEVIILHVSDHVKLPTMAVAVLAEGVSSEEIDGRVEELRRKNKVLEDDYNAKCNSLHVKHKVVIISDNGHGPGQAIVECAKRHHVNMIVLGSRGHGTLRRTFVGSCSDYVCQHSHIPTLVCPAEKHHHHHKH